jgi:hypothetical protein
MDLTHHEDDDDHVPLGDLMDAARFGLLKTEPVDKSVWERSQAAAAAFSAITCKQRAIASNARAVAHLERLLAMSDDRLAEAREFGIGDADEEQRLNDSIRADLTTTKTLRRELEQTR